MLYILVIALKLCVISTPKALTWSTLIRRSIPRQITTSFSIALLVTGAGHK
jgi:hypothetical protein